MILLDSRRLTGANLYWNDPAAIIDIGLRGEETKALIDTWAHEARLLLSDLGRGDAQLTHRGWDGGVSLLISAPIDALYSMCELNELAWRLAEASLGQKGRIEERASRERELERLSELFDEEATPRLIEIQDEAAQHAALFLWDDDEVSVGAGRSRMVWRAGELPSPCAVPWSSLKSIPVAMVTGTNGKSTTVRMAAVIIKAAGHVGGITSTDSILVGDTIIDRGDYSGTGGARTIMRHPNTEIAVLEVARGGLLRRGLGVPQIDVALITNVAADHLGEYGINSVAELIEAKFIVRRALTGSGALILNADDAGIVAHAAGLDQALQDQVQWFSLAADNSIVRGHVDCGGIAYVLEAGWLTLLSPDGVQKIVAVADIPAALDGAARHNISNGLAAMGLCSVLGLGPEAIREGLVQFRGDASDNPGRGNWFEHRGVRMLVDFAHNEHGMSALADMVSRVPANRRVLTIGQAGDRSDQDIIALTLAACTMRPDQLMICGLSGYERGRSSEEVKAVIHAAALTAGLDESRISEYPDPVTAAAHALGHARDGDLLVFLALTQRDEVLGLIRDFLGT